MITNHACSEGRSWQERESSGPGMEDSVKIRGKPPDLENFQTVYPFRRESPPACPPNTTPLRTRLS